MVMGISHTRLIWQCANVGMFFLNWDSKSVVSTLVNHEFVVYILKSWFLLHSLVSYLCIVLPSSERCKYGLLQVFSSQYLLVHCGGGQGYNYRLVVGGNKDDDTFNVLLTLWF